MTLSEEFTAEFVKYIKKFVDQLELELERKQKKEEKDQPDMPYDPDVMSTVQVKMDAQREEELRNKQKERWLEGEEENLFVPEAGQSQAEYLNTPYEEMPEEFHPDYDWSGLPDEQFVEFKKFSRTCPRSEDAMTSVLVVLNKWREGRIIKILGIQWSVGSYEASIEIMYIKEG